VHNQTVVIKLQDNPPSTSTRHWTVSRTLVYNYTNVIRSVRFVCATRRKVFEYFNDEPQWPRWTCARAANSRFPRIYPTSSVIPCVVTRAGRAIATVFIDLCRIFMSCCNCVPPGSLGFPRYSTHAFYHTHHQISINGRSAVRGIYALIYHCNRAGRRQICRWSREKRREQTPKALTYVHAHARYLLRVSAFSERFSSSDRRLVKI
jgi:hypothetical protein